MRKSTIGNTLLLCGLTAATAAFATGAPPQATENTMTMNNMMSNDTMADPMPGNDTMRPPAPMPTPAPAPTPPGTVTNELSPKPM